MADGDARDLATWARFATMSPQVPYVVIHRCVDEAGNVDEAALAIAANRYLHRKKRRTVRA